MHWIAILCNLHLFDNLCKTILTLSNCSTKILELTFNQERVFENYTTFISVNEMYCICMCFMCQWKLYTVYSNIFNHVFFVSVSGDAEAVGSEPVSHPHYVQYVEGDGSTFIPANGQM